MSSVFHLFDSGQRRLLTFSDRAGSCGGPMGASGFRQDSHGSLHTLMLSPFPTTHPRPFFSRSRPAKMLRQPCEGEAGDLHSRKEEFLAYFPSRTCATSDVGFLIRRQPIFANRASLNFPTSLKPKPPAYLGFVSVDQATQHIFFCSGLASHQNRVRRD
ncbi:hypothetical protein N665_0163s0055 [Sinapis alba]|nr:hypothetical protein N665_0163s0055 [Sinapis alba]